MPYRATIAIISVLVLSFTGCTHPALIVDATNGQIEIPADHQPAYNNLIEYIVAFGDEYNYKLVQQYGNSSTRTQGNQTIEISTGSSVLESAAGERFQINTLYEAGKPRNITIQHAGHPANTTDPQLALFTEQLASFITQSDSKHLPKKLRK